MLAAFQRRGGGARAPAVVHPEIQARAPGLGETYLRLGSGAMRHPKGGVAGAAAWKRACVPVRREQVPQ